WNWVLGSWNLVLGLDHSLLNSRMILPLGGTDSLNGVVWALRYLAGTRAFFDLASLAACFFVSLIISFIRAGSGDPPPGAAMTSEWLTTTLYTPGTAPLFPLAAVSLKVPSDLVSPEADCPFSSTGVKTTVAPPSGWPSNLTTPS